MGFAIKTLGIVGGIAPESTIDYYRRIIALYRERARSLRINK
jgi:aspartate/glutamate racemase